MKLSNCKNKKLDVFKIGIKIGFVGNLNFSDVPTYARAHGIDFARNIYNS